MLTFELRFHICVTYDAFLFFLLFQKSIVQTCLFCASACHVVRSFLKWVHSSMLYGK